MMSIADKVVPFSAAPVKPLSHGLFKLFSVPGLDAQTIQGLEATYPGTLTADMRSLLRKTSGLTATEFGTIDLTSRWHPEEPINVFRPCLTLAIDDEGRRWIAETSRDHGLPGPIWCVLPDPAVALYVFDDLNGFLTTLNDAAERGQLCRWLRGLHRDARGIWAQRQALARVSYESCREDQHLRPWLAGLPLDVHVYDLRDPSALHGWPYGLAGPEGRLYRCGRLPVFAVSTAPSASRRTQRMSQVAATAEILAPASTHALAARGSVGMTHKGRGPPAQPA
jgi:hypothetical protein